MASITQQLLMQTSESDRPQLDWERACIIASQSFPGYEPTYLARGLDIAQRRHVTLNLNDEEEEYAVVQSGKKSYTITKRGECPCPDSLKGQVCKHLMALDITLAATRVLEEEYETSVAIQEATTEAIPAEIIPPTSSPIAPVLAEVRTRTIVENPAGANFKARIGTMELWYTWHDTTDEALKARLQTMLPELQEIVLACEERQRDREQAVKEEAKKQKASEPEATITVTTEQLNAHIAKAVKAALSGYSLPAATSNGIKPNGGDQHADTNPAWCAVHGEEMVWHPANDRGPGWYSHRLGMGGYCKGGN